LRARFANGIANIHNARRAHTPMVNVVGDHATYHRAFDPPLAADTEALARAASHWVRRSDDAASVGHDAADAVQAAASSPGRIASLILPADCAWNEGGVVAPRREAAAPPQVEERAVQEAATLLRRGGGMLLLGGAALGEAGLHAAHRIAQATGALLRTPTQVPRMARGRGRVPVDRIPYAVDAAVKSLERIAATVLVGAPAPAAFFAYPGKPSLVTPAASATHVLATPEEDLVDALERLAEVLQAPRELALPDSPAPTPAQGAFSAEGFAHTFAALVPDQAIVVEEGVTSGRGLFPPTFGAAPHDWLQITGGAIGYGFPCATGAAIGAPGRKVVCLQSDGGGMYSLQALWTQARERLDVINVVFANRMYRILHNELLAVGARPGRASGELFDIARPELRWTKIAEGLGVESTRVDRLESFADAFSAAARTSGPFLIELVI
jgi:acetolactate synthase I/II/III large subunit